MNVFITGASSGIGKSLARKLVQTGHAVWGIARSHDSLRDLSNELSQLNFSYSTCDVRDIDSVNSTLNAMSRQGFIPDTVVLNAGIVRSDVQDSLSYPLAKEVLDTNVTGALVWVNKFLPLFIKQNSGHFIALSSLFANWPDPTSVSYSASKSELSMAFRSLALHHRKTRINFTTMVLGPVLTTINSRNETKRSKQPLFSVAISEEKAAQAIIDALQSPRRTIYVPWVFKILKIISWLPDVWFERLTRPFRR